MAARGNDIGAVAKRYAGALFDLAREKNELGNVERGLSAVERLYQGNAEVRRLILSPIIPAMEQRAAMERILKDMRISGLANDFVMLLARNRRLFALDATIAAFRKRAASERGEVEAEVVTAQPMTDAQRQTLVDALREKLGKTPTLKVSVDRALLGGMVVKVGSQMIDTSLRTKLKTLEIAMKEAV